jgi:hypothetical protein
MGGRVTTSFSQIESSANDPVIEDDNSAYGNFAAMRSLLC